MDYRTAWDAYSASTLGHHVLPHWCVFWVTRWASTSPAKVESTTDYSSGQWREETPTLCRRCLQEQLWLTKDERDAAKTCYPARESRETRQVHCSCILRGTVVDVKPKGDIWYAAVPVGHNTLDKTVACMCSAAGITGFKTNHSLRVTLATRLFKEGVDEQLIMAKTGHRSADCTHGYKRVSKEQMELISNVVQGGSLEKKSKLESTIEDANKYMKPPMDKENVPTMLFRDCNITINFGK